MIGIVLGSMTRSFRLSSREQSSQNLGNDEARSACIQRDVSKFWLGIDTGSRRLPSACLRGKSGFCSVVRIGRSGRGWADTAHTTEDNQRSGEGPKFRQHYPGQKYPTDSTGPVSYFCPNISVVNPRLLLAPHMIDSFYSALSVNICDICG